MAVYDELPAGSRHTGMEPGPRHAQRRRQRPKATVPQGAYCAWTFRAPTGAKLSRISYHHDFCGWAGFKAGIMNASGTWLHAAQARPLRIVRRSQLHLGPRRRDLPFSCGRSASTARATSATASTATARSTTSR